MQRRDPHDFPFVNRENKHQNINLESILKGTAKFKESRNKLEQSYNSLMMDSIIDGEKQNELSDDSFSSNNNNSGEFNSNMTKDELLF